MKVYILSHAYASGSEDIRDRPFYIDAPFTTLAGAQEMAQERFDSELEWVHHDSHGPMWVASHENTEGTIRTYKFAIEEHTMRFLGIL